MKEKTKKRMPYNIIGFVFIAVAIGLLFYFYGESCRRYEDSYLYIYEIKPTGEKLTKMGYFWAENKVLILASLFFIVPGLLCFKAGLVSYEYNTELAQRISNLNAAKKFYSVGKHSPDGVTLRVSQKSKLFAEVLGIKNYTISKYTYNEEKIHVGAVTVGGVTSGGAYKTGGDYSVRSYRSDKKELHYNYVENKKICSRDIAAIELSKELAKEARTSSIAEYLDGDTIKVFIDVPLSSRSVALAQKGDFSGISRELAAGKPTQEKCEAIIKWLSEE